MTTRTLFLLISLLSFSFSTALSQNMKGRMMIGGRISFSGSNYSESNIETSSYGFSVRPNFGGFVSKNISLGIIADYRYGTSTTKSTFNSENRRSETHTAGAAGQFRHYKFFGSKFAFISLLTAGYSRSFSTDRIKNSTEHLTTKSFSDNINVDVSPAIVYFVSPKFGLELGFGRIGYGYVSTVSRRFGSSNRSERSSFNIDFGLNSLEIGLMYYFGGQKEQ